MSWLEGVELMEKLYQEKATKEQYFSFLEERGGELEEEEVLSDFNVSTFLKHHKALGHLKNNSWYWIKQFNDSKYELAVFFNGEFSTVGSEISVQKEEVFFIDTKEIVRDGS